MKTFPPVTLCLCMLMLTLYALPEPLRQTLYFDHGVLATGQYLGLISGHWLHVGADHLVWNLSALAVLGWLIECFSKRLLLLSLLAGMLAVDLALLSPLTSLERYCGLSGVLNTLMGVTLYLQWRHTRSFVPLAVAFLWCAKVAVEALSGQGIFTNTAWPPFAGAHLAGMLATPLVFIIGGRFASAIGPNNKELHA